MSAKRKSTAKIKSAPSPAEAARLETQSAQAQKMQAVGQLAGGVAHDFNNLLTAIIAACDSLPRDREEIGEIKRHAERGADLVRQLLAFSRRQTLRPIALDLGTRARNICDLVQRLLGAPITLTLDLDEPIWPVLADPTQLDQIIVNLAVNARDAMPKGGRLAIHIRNMAAREISALDHILMPSGDYVLFEMADSGCGIRQADIGNIFEPFFSTKAQGSGLGLSTVYGIVKQSGGFIFPESKTGKGTIFRIYLPRHRPKKKRGAEKSSAARPIKKIFARQKTVLLVEDEPAIRQFAQRALKQQGFEVIAVESAEAALAVKGKIDMLVSDVVMSGMDGVKLAETLAARHPKMKIILISGYAEDAFRDPALSLKMRFLPKPFGLKELILAVSAALDDTAPKS